MRTILRCKDCDTSIEDMPLRTLRCVACQKKRRCEKERARRVADPEKIRAQERARYAANREKMCEQERVRRAADPDKYRARQRQWRADNLEWAKERTRAYRAENVERVRAQKRAWYRANKEKVLAYSHARYAADPEKMKDYQRSYREANREKVREYARQLYERRGGKGYRKTVTIQALIDRDGMICAWCGQFLDDPYDGDLTEIDHIVPVTLGGAPKDLDNLQLLHAPCNTSKRQRPMTHSPSRTPIPVPC